MPLTLSDFIVRHFTEGTVRFRAETHVTPHGVVKFRLITDRLGVYDELESIVHNNNLKVIENEVPE